jgi:hypothetical protein
MADPIKDQFLDLWRRHTHKVCTYCLEDIIYNTDYTRTLKKHCPIELGYPYSVLMNYSYQNDHPDYQLGFYLAVKLTYESSGRMVYDIVKTTISRVDCQKYELCKKAEMWLAENGDSNEYGVTLEEITRIFNYLSQHEVKANVLKFFSEQLFIDSLNVTRILNSRDDGFVRSGNYRIQISCCGDELQITFHNGDLILGGINTKVTVGPHCYDRDIYFIDETNPDKMKILCQNKTWSGTQLYPACRSFLEKLASHELPIIFEPYSGGLKIKSDGVLHYTITTRCNLGCDLESDKDNKYRDIFVTSWVNDEYKYGVVYVTKTPYHDDPSERPREEEHQMIFEERKRECDALN